MNSFLLTEAYASSDVIIISGDARGWGMGPLEVVGHGWGEVPTAEQ